MSSSSSSRGGGEGGPSEVVVIVSPPSRVSETVIPAAAASTSTYVDETRQKGEEDGVSKTRQCPLLDDEGTAAEDKRCSSSSPHQSQPTLSLAQSLQPHSATAGTRQMAVSASSSITRLPPHTSYPSTPPSPKLFPSPYRPITAHPSKSSSTAPLGTAPTTASTHLADRPSSPEDDNEGHSSYSPLHPVRDFDSAPDMGQRSSLEYSLSSLSSLTMNIALTVGIVCGTVVLISVTIYALVRCGRPHGDPGSYKADRSLQQVRLRGVRNDASDTYRTRRNHTDAA